MNEHDLHTFVYMMLQYDPRRESSKDWALFSFEAPINGDGEVQGVWEHS